MIDDSSLQNGRRVLLAAAAGLLCDLTCLVTAVGPAVAADGRNAIAGPGRPTRL